MFEGGTDPRTEAEPAAEVATRSDASIEFEEFAAAMTDSECMLRVIEIEQIRGRLDAEQVHLIRAIDRRGAARHLGWRSMVTWLKKRAGMSGSVASAKVRAAHALGDLPHTEAALDTGAITLEHAVAIARQHRPETQRLLAEHEAGIVEQARRLTVDQLRVVMAHWNELATQELAREPESSHKDQYFHFNETTGAWFGDCKLAPEDGAIVHGVLEKLGRELYAAAKRDREVDATLDPFTFGSEVRASALVEMARRADAWDPKQRRYREPAFTVVIPLADLAAGLGAQTEAGHWIPGETIKRLTCTGTITPVIVESLEHPVPLDVGRTLRLPGYEQRKAIIARDVHCRFPGCDMPATRCEVHHLIPWEEGGPSDLENLALYCRRHHHMGHEGGWHYSGDANAPNRIQHRRPDGTLLTHDRTPRDESPTARADPSDSPKRARGAIEEPRDRTSGETRSRNG